jgi:multidrug resistance protein MdtO
MTIAATLVMIINMTFRIPYGAYAALYAFNISRESPETTVKAVQTIVVAYALSVLYILAGAMFFLQDPNLRLFWVIATLFVMFYALSAATNNTAAARFGYLLIITIPVWDSQIPVGDKVEQTLWAFAAISLASVITVAVPLIYAKWKSRDILFRPIAERLSAIENLLDSYVAGNLPDEKTEKQITHFALAGHSALRRTLQHSTCSPQYREQMGAVVTLVGRLIDVAANMIELAINTTDYEKSRMRSLAAKVGTIRSDLLAGRIPHLELDAETATLQGAPLLSEMETTVALIPGIFTGGPSPDSHAVPHLASVSALSLFKPDAFTNPEHIKFGLKGCFAASLCYIFYNAKAWPEINTAITTCFLTALSTIGSSHQKQVLRISGALVGAVVMGIGAQVFILPYLDSIAGFTLVFVAATIVAAWCAASSPRFSYFGVQIAIAFYLVNLTEFSVQTSLLPARDRVLGILLGLLAMWLVFDHLWGVSAVVEMNKTFISSLRMLAEFVREPLSKDLERSYALRETINGKLDKVRALADDALLEFERTREEDLAFPNRIRPWETQLRIFFITKIATWKYRAHLPGFELPESIAAGQGEFDENLARALDAMADRLEGRSIDKRFSLENGFALLERAVQDARRHEPQECLSPPRFQTFLSLHQKLQTLITWLEIDILEYVPSFLAVFG